MTKNGDFDIVSNPNFYQGKRIHDFLHPDRAVVVSDDERPVAEVMRRDLSSFIFK